MMRHLRTFFSLSVIAFASHSAYAQTVERTVVANQAETLTSPTFNMTYVLGEVVGDLLPNPGVNLFLTLGFIQPDIDLQQVANADISKSIILYPNPAKGSTVKLAFNNLPDGTYYIDIIDAVGRVLKSQTVNYSNNNFFYLPLDISQLAGGVYFIKVVNSLSFRGQIKLIKI